MVAFGVFLVCAVSGFITGQIIKKNQGWSYAATANITVTDNNQIITLGQGDPPITRISTVIVKDNTAVVGYILTAKFGPNTSAFLMADPSFSVTIGSNSSIDCSVAYPCALTSSTKDILATNSNNATLPTGDETVWEVTITLPAGTPTGNYLVDIEYDERAKAMQDFTSSQCANMTTNTEISLKDARDGKAYRIKKMLDNKCWMISNLAYAGGGTNTYSDVHTLTFANATSTSPWTQTTGITTRYVTTNNYTGADQLDRDGNSIQNTAATFSSGVQCTTGVTGTMNSRCLSYLYNFCAANGLDSGTTPTCAAAINTGSGTGYATTGVIGAPGGFGGESKGSGGTSICPAGWRLPVGRVGTRTDTRNEFAVLNGSMYNGTYTPTPNITATTGYYQNWQPAGPFAGVGPGYFYPGNGLASQSTNGYFSSSSLLNSTEALGLDFTATSLRPGTATMFKYNGFAVRCVM